MQITTIQDIDSTNYDQPDFYYRLTNPNNAISVGVNNTNTLTTESYMEVSLDGTNWVRYGKAPVDNTSLTIISLMGIAAFRIKTDGAAIYNMTISEFSIPVNYMRVG